MARSEISKPAEQAERQIIQEILNGGFPADSALPPERALAGILGVTRPTLREVLQRISRAGWIEIHHGKPTRVRDILVEGNLSLLSEAAIYQPPSVEMTGALLELRLLLAPTYTREAVTRKPEEVLLLSQSFSELTDDLNETALADWHFHHGLAILSGNPLSGLILNSLENFWVAAMIPVYENAEERQKIGTAIRMIGKAARAEEPEVAEVLIKRVLQESQTAWLVKQAS